MILSRDTVLKLVQNHDLVAALPSILPYVERHGVESRRIQGATGCKPCQMRSALAPLGSDVIAFLMTQPPEAIDVLRQRLRDAHLFVYDPAQRGRVLVELGVKP